MNTPFIGSMHLSLPLLLLLGKATIILLVALGATLAMQRASAGARHLVWLVTLATLLLVPALTTWGPVKVALLPTAEREEGGGRREEVEATPADAARTETQTPTPVASRVTPQAGQPSSLLPPSSSPLSSLSLLQLLLAAWALVTVAILASLAWSGLTVRRIVRNASPLEHESWRTPLYEVADRMGLADAPRLLKSDDAKMPFACGIATPTIVLPAECDGWSLERRRAVLLHELAHVRRHDLLGHTIGRVACALYWFHPLAWTAARHLRNESERACDDLALSCGTRATDYAEHLLEIVTSVRKDATPSVALAMARRKEFEGRMLAILDPELRHSSPTRRQSAALIGSLALVALTVGAVSPVARTAEAAQAVPEPSISGSDAQQHAAERTVFRADTARREVVRSTITAGTTPSTVERAGADAGRTAGQFAGQFAGRTAGQYAGQYAGAATTAVINNVVQALTEAPKQVIAQAAGLEILARPDVQAAIRGANGSAKAQSRDERVQLLAKVLATDTSASLRRVAAWGLHEYADQQVAVDALATALRKDASTAVREMAAWALGEGSNHNGVATDALSAALKGDADEKVRATSAWALGQAGDRGSVDALVAALSSSSPTVRTRALWAIGTVEPRQAPREVIALLRDPEPRVRHLAAWALYQIEDPATAGPLKDAIAQEQDKDVQLAEIRALGALGEKSVEALKALVESSDPRMRSMAVHALAGGQASGPWPWPWPQPRPFP